MTLTRTRPIRSRRSRPRRRQHPMPMLAAGAPMDPSGAPAVVEMDPDQWAAEVERRASGRCQGRLHRHCRHRGEHAHHRLRRRHPGAWVVDNGVWLCVECHDLIHFQLVDWARRHLWLLSPGHPFDPPVRCALDCPEDHRRPLEATA